MSRRLNGELAENPPASPAPISVRPTSAPRPALSQGERLGWPRNSHVHNSRTVLFSIDNPPEVNIYLACQY